MAMDTLVRHLRTEVDGIDTFYREAGPADAPVLLLPHGYPCSSYEFRNLMPKLADRWRLLTSDYPGAGYSATPDNFDYSFDGLARWLDGFVRRLRVDRFAIWLHDFGSPIGARLAIMNPQRIVAQIIQNGDIPYEDALGPKYADIEASWSLPWEEMRTQIADGISEDTFREEFLNDLDPELAAAIPPDLWHCTGR
jgi:pimeloyl-ACP methyl ester carboxylesterase